MKEDRESTELEKELWNRILAGMLEDDKGFVSSHRAAFRAWVLTVVKPYTDFILTERDEALIAAAREVLEYLDECEGFADDVQGQSDDRKLTGKWVDDAVKSFKGMLTDARNILNAALVEGVGK